MQAFYYIFWFALFIIFYNYIGYGILLWIITSFRSLFRSGNRRHYTGEDAALLPDVTLVVAAYNEEAVIEEKIANCLALDYPAGKLTVLFITDGSSDATPEIISRYPEVMLLHRKERNGKTAALNRAMKQVCTSITVFCDANTVLNKSAIKEIARHYQNPATGGVAGEKRIFTAGNTQTSAAGEGLYWKYESLLKRLDAELYTVTGAAGELFSIRTALWEPLPEDVVLDDFVISTRVNLHGYRIAYEPRAYASELPSASLGEEKKRKIRIAAGAFQAMTLVKPVFNFLRHPVLFFQFFSHRFLRWTLTPLSFPVLLLANLGLVLAGAGIFFEFCLIAQTGFYLLALTGAWLADRAAGLKALKIFHYILFMNYTVYLGFARFMQKKQSAVWDKAERKVTIEYVP